MRLKPRIRHSQHIRREGGIKKPPTLLLPLMADATKGIGRTKRKIFDATSFSTRITEANEEIDHFWLREYLVFNAGTESERHVLI